MRLTPIPRADQSAQELRAAVQNFRSQAIQIYGENFASEVAPFVDFVNARCSQWMLPPLEALVRMLAADEVPPSGMIGSTMLLAAFAECEQRASDAERGAGVRRVCGILHVDEPLTAGEMRQLMPGDEIYLDNGRRAKLVDAEDVRSLHASLSGALLAHDANASLKGIKVERDTTDPTRLNVTFPPGVFEALPDDVKRLLYPAGTAARLDLDASELSMVALALSELALRRPGWSEAIYAIAGKIKIGDALHAFRVTSADSIEPSRCDWAQRDSAELVALGHSEVTQYAAHVFDSSSTLVATAFAPSAVDAIARAQRIAAAHNAGVHAEAI